MSQSGGIDFKLRMKRDHWRVERAHYW